MAKDGTSRGGARPRSGPKPSNQSNIETGMMGVFDFPEPDDLSAEFVPPIDDFLLETQKDGSKLEADKVFISTYLWLKSRGCENLVPKQLINEYAMSVARWIQAERYVSKYGALAMHPTVKSPITSPYVTMSQNYIKQITNTWYQIYTIVKDSGNDMTGGGDTDDPMEKLLRAREVK